MTRQKDDPHDVLVAVHRRMRETGLLEQMRLRLADRAAEFVLGNEDIFDRFVLSLSDPEDLIALNVVTSQETQNKALSLPLPASPVSPTPPKQKATQAAKPKKATPPAKAKRQRKRANRLSNVSPPPARMPSAPSTKEKGQKQRRRTRVVDL